ncbi:hypothetical protein LCGC14_1805730 [marine sediment metagenome]|uniref:Uncharacterized protein n=1 Tax=marine sediment metagenome TaxID=412755 RepID=A0A0F9JMZ6_9ZZZZ
MRRGESSGALAGFGGALVTTREDEMEISEEEAERMLNNPKNLMNNVRFVKLRKGGRNGGKEVPKIIRELIGIAAHKDPAKVVAGEFGVSTSTVAAAKKGNVGVNRHDPELKDKIDTAVDEEKKSVRDVALDRVAHMLATTITPASLDGVTNPAKAVSIAKDLAAIADKVQTRGPNVGNVVFMHMAREKAESEYGDPIIIEHVPDKKRSD